MKVYAVLTNDKKYAELIKLYRENGINFKNNHLKKPYYPRYYEQIKTGYNYRMSDISAALGISQIKKIKNFIKQRNKKLQILINRI